MRDGCWPGCAVFGCEATHCRRLSQADIYGPRGTEIRFEGGKVVDYSWAESTQRWRARQAAGFSREELST